MADPIRIALIDDDEAVLDSLRLYFDRRGLDVACFARADAFLGVNNLTGRFDCVVADVRMPGMSGLDLVQHLANEKAGVPVVLITGHGDVDMAVAAIKSGAFDFIEKPFDEKRLLASVEDAVMRRRGHAREAEADEAAIDLRRRADTLSERQREVMELAAEGLSNKEIAQRLRISPRTVEIHRAWMMERMGARNLAELVRMAMRIKGK